MKKILCLHVAVALLLTACTSRNQQAVKKIKALEKEIFTPTSPGISVEKGELLSSTYLTFVKDFPQDSLAPVYLFKAAEVKAGIGKAKEAVELYKDVYTKYPNSSKADYSLFLEAFVSENQLKDTAYAKQIYSKFLSLYPKHPLRQDVLFSLAHMGKSDADILKSIEQKKDSIK